MQFGVIKALAAQYTHIVVIISRHNEHSFRSKLWYAYHPCYSKWPKNV